MAKLAILKTGKHAKYENITYVFYARQCIMLMYMLVEIV